MEDENSPNYKNILIDINIIVGFLDIYWQPIIIKKLLGFFAYNDIIKDKIQKDIGLNEEIFNQTNVKSNENLVNLKEKPKNITCSEFKYIYIRVGTILNEINITLIQPILNINIFELNIKKGNLTADMYVDHFKIYGNLDAFSIKDLSNYPHTIKKQNEYKIEYNKGMLFTQNKNSLEFEFISKSKVCCLYNKEDDITSEINLNIKNVTIYFYQESFLRFFNYLISEFLGSLGPQQKIVEYRESKEKKISRKKTVLSKISDQSADDFEIKFKSKNEFTSSKLNLNTNQYTDEFNKNVQFMKLNIIIENPKLILKARPSFSEFFEIKLSKLCIGCTYDKKFQAIRNLTNFFRYVSIYKLDIKDFSIKTHDDFYICDPTNTLVNMHFTMLSEDDMKKSDLFVDKSFRFDVIINLIRIRLRQADFRNILMLNDLNLAFSDGQIEEYDYAKFNKHLYEKQNEHLDKDIKFNLNNIKILEEKEDQKEININNLFKDEYHIIKTKESNKKKDYYNLQMDNFNPIKTQPYEKHIIFNENKPDSEIYSEAQEEILFKSSVDNARNIKFEDHLENINKVFNKNDLINLNENKINFSYDGNLENEEEIIDKQIKEELMEKYHDINLNLLIDKIEINLICHNTKNNNLNNFAGLSVDRLFLKYNRKLNKNQYMNLNLNEIFIVEKNLNYDLKKNYYYNKYKKDNSTNVHLVFNNQLQKTDIEDFLNMEFKSLTNETLLKSNYYLSIISNDDIYNKKNLNKSFDTLINNKDFNERANEIIKDIEIKNKNGNKRLIKDMENNKRNNQFFNENNNDNFKNENYNRQYSYNFNTNNESEKKINYSTNLKEESDIPYENKSIKLSKNNTNIISSHYQNNQKQLFYLEQDKIIINKKKIIKEYDKLKKNLLLLKEDVYESEIFKKSEVYLEMIINSERDKNYEIFLNNLKVLVKLDTFLLIKQFVLEGFPFYSTNDKELPMMYEKNEEKNPGMHLKLFIKNPKLGLLTDSLDNFNQDLICLTSDIDIEMKNEKILKIKEEIYQQYLDHSKKKEEKNLYEENIIKIDFNEVEIINDNRDHKNIKRPLLKEGLEDEFSGIIYFLEVECRNLCPFIIKFSDFINPLYSEIQKNRRKIIEEFDFIYSSNSELKLNSSRTLFNLISNSLINFDETEFSLKASYRDIVLLLKSYEFNINFSGREFEDKIQFMKSYSNRKSEKDSSTEYTKLKRNNNIINCEDMARQLKLSIQKNKHKKHYLLDDISIEENEKSDLIKRSSTNDVHMKRFYEKNNELYKKVISGKRIDENEENFENYNSEEHEEKIPSIKNSKNHSFNSIEDYKVENENIGKDYLNYKSKLFDEEKNSVFYSKNNIKSHNNIFSLSNVNENDVNNYNIKKFPSNKAMNNTEKNDNFDFSNKDYKENLNIIKFPENKNFKNIELSNINPEDTKKEIKRKATLIDIYNSRKIKNEVKPKKRFLNRATFIGALDGLKLKNNKEDILKAVKDLNILNVFSDDIIDKNDILNIKNSDEEKCDLGSEIKVNSISERYIKNKKTQKIDLNKFLIIDNKENKMFFNFKKIEIILINDHANHYYPFFSIKFKNLNIKNIGQFSKSEYIINSELKLKTFNYIANLWEPLLEKTFLYLEYKYSKQVNDNNDKEKTYIFITFMNQQKNKAKLDLNISDLTVNLLLHIFNIFYSF